MRIEAGGMHFQQLNEAVRASGDETVVIDRCLGQRYIGDGLSGKKIVIHGTPGNALGAYMDGAEIEVYGNVQDAVGDTMNDGRIVVHGSAGDAAGYAMRGGRILVEGDAGYRAGIHMKAYRDKCPVLVIGGRPGSFLGEYQAGGLILVLQLYGGAERFGCPFCAAGMHGGKIVVRCDEPPRGLAANITCRPAREEDRREIAPYLEEFCRVFGYPGEEIAAHPFHVLTPDTKNPYKQLYTGN